MSSLYILMLVMAPFAVYRVSLMITAEEGPLEIFLKFRNLYTKNDWIGRGIRCPSCVSFWAGLTMSILVFLLGNWIPFQVGAVALGFSGIAVYLVSRR